MSLSGAVFTCLMAAAGHYGVPWQVMAGVHAVEGGKVGQEVSNTNGTRDLGPMQINTVWMKQLARHWGVSSSQARMAVRDDACVNMMVAAYILKQHYMNQGSWIDAIRYYHSGTPGIGHRYAKKVVAAMTRQGLIDWSESAAPAAPRPEIRVVQVTPPRNKPTLLAQR